MTKARAGRGKGQRGVDPAAQAAGRRMRQLREASGLTQEEVARRAKVTAKFISQVENGRVNPSIGVVARLAQDGLRMPLAAFFSDGDPGVLSSDLTTAASLLGGQPETARHRAIRVLRALFDE